MHFRKNDMIGNCLNKGSSIAMKKKCDQTGVLKRKDTRQTIRRKKIQL